ncbi:MAG: hypothetical protein ABF370_03750 [Verrucomicrobiales bacterium]
MPDMEERWSIVTALTQSQDDAALLGSPELIGQVCEEAEDLAPHVEARKVVSRQHLKRALVAVSVTTALGVVLFFSDHERSMVLLQRLFAAGSSISLAKGSADRGDLVTPKDEPAQISASQSGRGVDEAILWMEETEETLRRVALPRQPDGRFVHELPSVRRDFRYRFRAGDGQTPWHQVRAVQRPRITGISIKITPPAYTKLPLVE